MEHSVLNGTLSNPSPQLRELRGRRGIHIVRASGDGRHKINLLDTQNRYTHELTEMVAAYAYPSLMGY